MKRIRENCFYNSGIEEIILPRMPKKIPQRVFNGCKNLKQICVKEGYTIDAREYVKNSVKIVPARMTAGKQSLRDLKRQKDVVIPEGIEKIENGWLWGMEVESVTIPASVKEIQARAFSCCKNLTTVTFK